ncbi:MAG: PAS domain S-box protein [Cyanobacteria bacterium SZAS-4]|nr:PAS domain S-box protein [Cyanobacteria bacterium SZAS-4]
MRRIPVAAQVLILAIVPLVMQLLLLVWMADLQSQAEFQLNQAVKQKRVADNLSKLMATSYDVIRHVSDDPEEQLKASENAAEQTRQAYDDLRGVVEPGTPLHAAIERSEKASHTVQRIFRDIVLAPSDRARKPMWPALRGSIKEMIFGGLLDAEKGLKQLAEQSMVHQSALREKFQHVALFGSAATLLVSGAIALVLAGNISRRLKRLDDNNLRMASNLPLLPAMTGKDEIARIDQTFHQMVKVLQDTANKEHLVIEGARDVICSIEKSGRVVAINPACTKMLGYLPEDMIGARLINFIAEDAQRAGEFLEQLQRENQHEPIEIKLWHKDKREIDTSWSVQWSKDEQIAFCVVHDISDRRAAERLRQEVLHMVSHDLRTPLTTLGNVFEFLSNADSDMVEKRSHYVRLGERNVERLIGLISDLLDVEKIRSGKMMIDRESVHLDECFQACIEALSPTADAKGVTLQMDETTCVVSGDPNKIDRVIINLVGNAIKYSDKGDLVKVDAQTDERNVTVTIADEGQGIPEDQLDKVFERFHQVSSEDQSTGSGLGLTIAKLSSNCMVAKFGQKEESRKAPNSVSRCLCRTRLRLRLHHN